MALSDEYSTKIVAGRQRKHIWGTKEFEQNRRAMQKRSPGSEPSILTANAEKLVERYMGKGVIRFVGASIYPQETIDTDEVVGKTWVKSLHKYVDTKKIKILYSSIGVHVIPVNDYYIGG